jgi:twitching motility protein PilJ
MTAMEEGIQQVIDVTERSEQAKKSLEDIIQVSNRIDTLVRSITADTVKQRENSLNVAQVMQSVELTAQETSQESQRVAGSLQKLVGISRDLLSSVERFKVDAEDNK